MEKGGCAIEDRDDQDCQHASSVRAYGDIYSALQVSGITD